MNRVDLIRLAQNVALASEEARPSYIQPGFTPHAWVITAMAAAYAEGWAAKEDQLEADMTGMSDAYGSG